MIFEYSLSLSTIFTTVWLGSLTIILSGSEDWLMVRVKFSLISASLSSVIATSNETLVSPAVNVMLYGPEA